MFTSVRVINDEHSSCVARCCVLYLITLVMPTDTDAKMRWLVIKADESQVLTFTLKPNASVIQYTL